MIKFCILTYVFYLLCFLGFSQEKDDSIKIQFDYHPKSQINLKVFDNIFFHEYFPMSGKQAVTDRMNKMIFTELSEASLNQSNAYLSDSYYTFKLKGYSFWQNNSPLAIGMSYSFKELFGWEKFDLFFDANGTMINNFNLKSTGIFIISNQERSFYWEVGGGISYEFLPRKTLFLKSSAMFNNKQYIGQKHVGGIIMKF